MSLNPGYRFGRYEVVAPIGAGGMGEVYRATDTDLHRSVALKVLPDGLRLDPEASLRFEREARLLAALNHPNIATLHGLETSGNVQALVMELVEGEGLDVRIARSPHGIPIGEATEIAMQIATALEAAHERGVVHRDLKPANIKIRPDGTVKVLDFGIAKALSTEGGTSAASTVTQMPGAIIGTPSYMSPEQASGTDVDRKTDIWAFGCVLFEMLTGQRSFDGETNSRILARVLERDPDWSQLPDDLHPRLRTLLRQCLEKNARRRRRDAGDVRLELELAASEPAEETSTKRNRAGNRIAWVVAIATPLLVGAAAVYVYRTRPPIAQSVTDIVTPVTRQPHEFAVSPDGRYIAYVAAESADTIVQVLYLRDLETGAVDRIAGTEGSRLPCWSPDSRSIAFVADEFLQRVEINGGAPRRLAPALNGLGCSWGESGKILFTPSSVTELYVVSDSGGDHRPVTRIELDRAPSDPAYETNHRYPSFIAGTDQFLYYVAGGSEVQGIHLGSLDETPSTRLIAADSAGVFVAPDWVVYSQNNRLLARHLDLKRRALTGEPESIGESTGGPGSGFAFSASRNGDRIAYRDMANPSINLTVFNRSGQVLSVGESRNGVEVSSDDRLTAFDRTYASRDVYVSNLAGDDPRRITVDPTVEGYPEFSPDNRELVYERQRPEDSYFELWRVDWSRPETAMLFYSEAESMRNLIPLDWSVNGFVIARRSDRDFLASDLIAVSALEPDPVPFDVVSTAYEERMAQVSPDGDWVAYDSNRPGRFGVFVQSFPDPDANGRYQVTDDGFAPRWNADGTEIYFLTLAGRVMAAPVSRVGSELEIGTPVALFSAQLRGPSFNHSYAVTSDGRFLIDVLEVDDNPTPIRLIQHSSIFGDRR